MLFAGLNLFPGLTRKKMTCLLDIQDFGKGDVPMHANFRLLILKIIQSLGN